MHKKLNLNQRLQKLITHIFYLRSLLADIIQPQDVKALCSVLVAVSEEAAKTSTEKRLENQTETSLASSAQDNNNGTEVEKAVSGNEAGADESNSDGSKGKSLSPETLALMCDEQDTMLMVAASSNCSVEPPNGQDQGYAEQEKIVLTKFRDCLNRIISYAELKGLLHLFSHYGQTEDSRSKS